MKHLRTLDDAKIDTESLLTIGVFDGVHLGHQALIKRLVATAHASARKAVVITFFPHPDKVVDEVADRYYLTTPDQRADLLLQLGADLVITLHFDEAMRHLPATTFVDRLVEYLRIKELWVGADFALGFQREGDISFLRAQGRSRGFTVTAVELITQQNSDILIRSSKVRDHVRRGEIRQASAMLGRLYALRGAVVRGEGRGRTIGVPTANLDVWSEQIMPANGVYATWAILGDEIFMAATNIGQRPTFGGTDVSVEPHILDFDRDIYGEKLELKFVERLRAEHKFESLAALVAQIQADIAAARTCLERRQPN